MSNLTRHGSLNTSRQPSKLFERVLREADVSKVKKFNTPYFEKLAWQASEKMDSFQEETPEYDAYNFLQMTFEYTAQYLNTNHETSWGLKRVRAELYNLINNPVEFLGLSANNGSEGYSEEAFQACYEDGIVSFIKKYVKDSQLIEALNYVKNSILKNIDTKKVDSYNKKRKAQSEEFKAKMEAQAAKVEEESKFLIEAAKKAKVSIDEIEGFENVSSWAVILDTEDDSKANDFRFEVGEILNVQNEYGASYDDIPGMGDIHLGCLQYYEWSEMNGGDVYEDLREDLRDKYVVFACPKDEWIEYRRMTDY